MDSSGMDLAVVGRPLERETSLYKGIGCVEVSPDVTGWCFTTVFLDAEGNVGGASVMLKARQCRQCGSASWSSSCRLRPRQVSGASSIR
jgi:hypothetical protein